MGLFGNQNEKRTIYAINECTLFLRSQIASLNEARLNAAILDSFTCSGLAIVIFGAVVYFARKHRVSGVSALNQITRTCFVKVFGDRNGEMLLNGLADAILELDDDPSAPHPNKDLHVLGIDAARDANLSNTDDFASFIQATFLRD